MIVIGLRDQIKKTCIILFISVGDAEGVEARGGLEKTPRSPPLAQLGQTVRSVGVN